MVDFVVLLVMMATPVELLPLPSASVKAVAQTGSHVLTKSDGVCPPTQHTLTTLSTLHTTKTSQNLICARWPLQVITTPTPTTEQLYLLTYLGYLLSVSSHCTLQNPHRLTLTFGVTLLAVVVRQLTLEVCPLRTPTWSTVVRPHQPVTLKRFLSFLWRKSTKRW